MNGVVKFHEMEDKSRCGKCREKMAYGQCGMECEMCREQFHMQCEGINQEDYKKLTEMEELI